METRSRIYASSVIYFFGAGFDFAVEAFEGVLRAAAEVEFLLVVLALFDVFFFATFGAGGGRGGIAAKAPAAGRPVGFNASSFAVLVLYCLAIEAHVSVSSTR